MNVLVVEDEALSRERITHMLREIDPGIDIIKESDSVEETVEYFKSKPKIDLAFFDIKLSDGLSFEIFNQVEVHTPIIFTTAYDDYALRAFKVNSIDYILKPINFEELGFSIQKFKNNFLDHKIHRIDPQIIRQLSKEIEGGYKKRFLVKFGDHLQIKSTKDVVCFYAEGKFAYLISKDSGRKYMIDHTLEDLETTLLDPLKFFRINRKFIVSIDHIEDVRSYINSRLSIKMTVPINQDLIVSREKVNNFKEWLNQ